MVESAENYTFIDLKSESARRSDQPAFHFLSEGAVRGQILNVDAGTKGKPVAVALVSIFTGISGEVKIVACDREFVLRPLSQLVLLPNVPFGLEASEQATCQWLQVPLTK
jgi:hypothetical protein